jgi:hypothetical protein
MCLVRACLTQFLTCSKVGRESVLMTIGSMMGWRVERRIASLAASGEHNDMDCLWEDNIEPLSRKMYSELQSSRSAASLVLQKGGWPLNQH